jgi:hypothetical protein
MATATGAAARLEAERRFYSGMAIYMIVVVFLGFAQSFYLRGLITFTPRPNPTLPPAVMIHGIVFSVWMLLVLTQSLLIGAGRRQTHRLLGVGGIALAALMVPLMYIVGVGQVARANQPPMYTPLAWTVMPIAAIPAFVILAGLGFRNRHIAQTHKRLMLGAALMMLEPAWGRLTPPDLVGVAVGGLLTAAPFLVLMRWDKRTLGRVHWASWLGILLVLGLTAFQVTMLATGWWDPIAERLPGV